MSIATRYERIRARLDELCVSSGRLPEEVLCLAVSKTVGLDEVAVAIEAGITAFGENRPDELVRKQAAFPNQEWHFIGNIQSRRITDIVSAATLIHSVAKAEHLQKIDTAARALNKVQPVLLEVNVSGEESKSGFSPNEVYDVIKDNINLSHIEICGLMTMAPQGDKDAILATFSGLVALRDALVASLSKEEISLSLSDISMGMTEDWPYAVALGTTIIRIGRAIFDDSFE